MRGGTLDQGRCVGKIFTMNQLCEKAGEKKQKVHVGFVDLEKAYNRDKKQLYGRY